jgi:hypothetical protein
VTAKTQPTDASVPAFLGSIPNAERRADAEKLCTLLSELTGEPPVLWGSSILGFGSHHYRYESGREGDEPAAGFAARKTGLVIYLSGDFAERDARLLEQLGPHKTGKSCLYVKRLADVDLDVLAALVARSLPT